MFSVDDEQEAQVNGAKNSDEVFSLKSFAVFFSMYQKQAEASFFGFCLFLVPVASPVPLLSDKHPHFIFHD